MEHVKDVLKTSLEELERVLDTKTVVGEPIVIEGNTLIPLISIGFGFGAGGATKNKSSRVSTPPSKLILNLVISGDVMGRNPSFRFLIKNGND